MMLSFQIVYAMIGSFVIAYIRSSTRTRTRTHAKQFSTNKKRAICGMSRAVAALVIGANVAGLANFKLNAWSGAAAVGAILYAYCGERLWRTKSAAMTAHEAHASDRNTMLLCVSTIATMLTTANVVLWSRGAVIHAAPSSSWRLQPPTTAQVIGGAGMLIGFLLRRSAMLQLGNRFTAKLALTTNHSVCREGLYQWVRHPGYTGNAFVFVSYALAVTGDVNVAVANLAMFLFTWTIRTTCEETMMLASEDVGDDYRRYIQEVRCRFFPWLW